MPLDGEILKSAIEDELSDWEFSSDKKHPMTAGVAFGTVDYLKLGTVITDLTGNGIYLSPGALILELFLNNAFIDFGANLADPICKSSPWIKAVSMALDMNITGKPTVVGGPIGGIVGPAISGTILPALAAAGMIGEHQEQISNAIGMQVADHILKFSVVSSPIPGTGKVE